MNKATKAWLLYFVIIFEARAVQLHADKGSFARESRAQAFAFEQAARILMSGLRKGKPPMPEALGFGQGFPPIAEHMFADILETE